MANVLSTDKQIAIVSALAEGSSIRSIERIAGVHRDTIMRLGVRVGQGCAAVLDDSHIPERRFSAPEIVITEKKAVSLDMRLASTSHIERLNGTTRLHMRRLTRLTYAFSKKLENFEAAVALHFAYYNLVKRHGTLRCTPAMAAGVEHTFWTVGELLEAAA